MSLRLNGELGAIASRIDALIKGGVIPPAIVAPAPPAQEERKDGVEYNEDAERQIEAGECDEHTFGDDWLVTPLSAFRYPLFVPTAYKGDTCTKTYKVYENDVAVAEQSVIIGESLLKGVPNEGVLRQWVQDVLVGLLRIWDKQGRIFNTEFCGVLTMTGYNLVRAIYGNDRAIDYKRVNQALRHLTGISIVVKTRYFNGDGADDSDCEFRLLQGFEWNTIGIDRQTGRPKRYRSSEVRITFSPRLTAGYLNKDTSIMLWDVYEALGRCEIAKMMYPVLVRYLSVRPIHQKSLKAWASYLGLTPYKYKSDRRDVFLQPIAMLQSKLIDYDAHMSFEIAQSKTDKDDYILKAFRRVIP